MISPLRSLARNAIPFRVRYAIATARGRANWYRTGEHVTFREAGFVAADSPSLLLARHNYEVEAIRKVLHDVHVCRGLEVGCGYGRLSPIFGEHVDELFAIDVNPDALALAERLYPTVHHQQASATALPFKDAEFGLVTSWTVLQHIPPEQFPAAVNELQRVLGSGGTLLLCEETKHADQLVHSGTHSWHRSLEEYQDSFDLLELQYDGFIGHLQDLADASDISDSLAPGRIMVFRRQT